MTAESSHSRNLIEVAFPSLITAIGLISLLIGTVWPDPRLVLSGVAVNPWIYLLILLFAGCLASRKSDIQLIVLIMMPSILLLGSIFWSLNADYGLYKYSNLIASSLVAIVFFIGSIRLVGVDAFLRQLTFFLLVLLAGAVVYKLQFGFFQRQVPYLLNGPIVFARLMGLGALAALFSLKGFWRVIVCLAFFLAVAWTGSKGPLLALVAVSGWAIWNSSRGAQRLAFVCIVTCVMAVFVGLLTYAAIELGSSRLFVILDIFTWDRSALGNNTSASVRLLAYINTFDLIVQNPIGVGLGAWSLNVSANLGLDYPHNLFLEVFSESGLLPGFLGLVPFLCFAFLPGVMSIKCIALFFLLAQQVSGDLLDARYLLAFSVLCCWLDWGVDIPLSAECRRGGGLKPKSARNAYA